MIDYFFGKPRTGKSYRAVKVIYDEYLKSEDSVPKFTNILTNIGGFKFKQINQDFKDRGSKSQAYKLVWSDFYEKISNLHKMALEEKSDDELNRYAYYHKINDCLIIIDEASLYMKRYDDVISWYLAYHGHFKVRIIIIAQSPKQINAEYLVHAEIYYEAQPQSKQLSNNKLRYILYSEPYFSKDNKFDTDTLKAEQKIYDLYKSGEVDKPKKMLYKFIFFMFLALLVMFALFKLLMYRLSPDVEDSNDTQPNHNYEKSYDEDDYKPPVVKHDGDILLTLRCDDRYCWNADTHYQDNQVTLNFIKNLVVMFNIDLKFYEVKNEIYILKSFEHTLSKKTLAKLTDYYYFIPKSLKNTYLSSLFVPVQQKIRMKRIDFKIPHGESQVKESNVLSSNDDY